MTNTMSKSQISLYDALSATKTCRDTQVGANRLATLLDTINQTLVVALQDAADDLADDYMNAMLVELETAYDGGNQAPKLDTSFPSKPGVFERDGRVYRIKPGSAWAKVLQADGKFEYVGNVNRMVRECDRISMERALELSAQMSSCCMCGRTLTAAKSVAAGIGPVCSGRAA